MAGSRLEERRFRRRSAEDVRRGFDNVTLPHRRWLAEALRADGARSFLEVGCGFGPNLEVLHEADPTLALTGVDISIASITEGRTRFAERGLQAIQLLEGAADALPMFAERSVDVVFADAALMYVGPDKIEVALTEMLRVARRRIVLLELNDGTTVAGRYTRDGWLRDYAGWLRKHPRVANVTSRPMPPGLRTEGRWPQYGLLVEATLR